MAKISSGQPGRCPAGRDTVGLAGTGQDVVGSAGTPSGWLGRSGINRDAVGITGSPSGQQGRRGHSRDAADIAETQAVSDDYYNDDYYTDCVTQSVMKNKCYMYMDIFVTVVRARISGAGCSGRISGPDVRMVIVLYYCLYVHYSDWKFGGTFCL